MKILSLVSQKGGAGKSCLSAHLAVAFEEAGIATLVIDLDQQASISQWGDSRKAEAPTVVAGRAARLPAMLDKARKSEIAFTILDTPSHSDKNALAAIAATDLVLMPTRPAIFDLRSIGDTVALLKLAKKQDQSVILLNAVPSRGAIADEAADFLKDYGIEVAAIRIKDRLSLSYALIGGHGITEFEPKGKAAGEIRALRAFLADRLDLTAGKGKG